MPTVDGAHIEVSDGWYSIGATLDAPLQALMRKREIFEGQKLRIFGAKVFFVQSCFHALIAFIALWRHRGADDTFGAERVPLDKTFPRSKWCPKSEVGRQDG